MEVCTELVSSGFLERVAWFVARAASRWGVFYRKSIERKSSSVCVFFFTVD
jgi:hypothetical protein